MNAKKIVLIGLSLVTAIVVCGLYAGDEKPAAGGNTSAVVVGTFDSRAVAVAYVRSGHWQQKLQQMKRELDEAKAAGDANKVKEIEQWGPAQQKKAHLQGFGTADVSEIIECIKDEIPAIAKEAGVDIIVSKWNVVYQGPSAKTVDITEKIVAPFNPDEKTLTIIRDLMTKTPVSQDVLEKMDHARD